MMMEYIFSCDFCDAKFERFIESQEVSNNEGTVHLYREFPVNWSFVKSFTICGGHKIEVNETGIYVDNKLVKVIKHG
jgi:hypothetical protein